MPPHPAPLGERSCPHPSSHSRHLRPEPARRITRNATAPIPSGIGDPWWFPAGPPPPIARCGWPGASSPVGRVTAWSCHLPRSVDADALPRMTSRAARQLPIAPLPGYCGAPARPPPLRSGGRGGLALSSQHSGISGPPNRDTVVTNVVIIASLDQGLDEVTPLWWARGVDDGAAQPAS